MFSKLLIPTLIYFFAFSFGLSVAGQDTIPPTITIYVDGRGGDFFETYISSGKSKDTLEIRFSCLYSFPGEYGPSYVNFEDDSEVLISNISSEKVIWDNINGFETGYGSVIQTIYAEDIYGNVSELIVKSTIGDIYPFNFLGLDFEGGPLGNLYVPYLSNKFSLDKTDFELCEDSKIDITANTSKNGCTGNLNINWYIDNRMISSDPDKISIDLSQQNDSFMVAIEADFSNTNFKDKISFNIQKATTQTVIHNPTCSNSTDGSIKLDSRIFGAMWEHTDSDALFLDSLKAGSYHVSYWFNDCVFNETITLIQENILEFNLSDTIIDLSKNETLTIRNLSNNTGESLWQIGDSIFIDNTHEFEYAFQFPGNYEIKLTDNSGFCNDVIYKNIVVEGDIPVLDTIPPTITIYVDGRGGDIFETYISSGKSKDTLEIRFSCLYSFPGEYGPSYVNFEDDSEVLISDITLNKVIRDNINGFETGYGSVIQTIYAEDIYGNISELIVKSTTGDIYSFDFDAMKVGDIDVFYVKSTNSLSQTDFEFCESQNVEVEVFYNKNGCTGKTRIDWYKNDVLVLKNNEKISINLNNETENIELAVDALFDNTDFQDRIKLNIRKITKYSLLEVVNPTCLNLTDGIIKFNANVFDITLLEHNGSDVSFDYKYNISNELYLDSLEAGTYNVSYIIQGGALGICEYNETITLIPENILDFNLSDTIIDLSQSEKLTISNLSNNSGEFLWQIGDSTFFNNENEFDYAFKLPGKYIVKLTDKSGFCNETIVKNIIVEGTTSVHDNPVSSIKIGPNPFTDILNIDLGKSADYVITIFGVDGSTCYKDQFRNIRNIDINLNFLAPGLFVLEIASSEKTELIKSFKIVKSDY
jgi:hypothetical protein